MSLEILDNEIVDRPLNGCPFPSHGCSNEKCPSTCFCEDHCSWKKCKLKDPPRRCLLNANRTWKFNEEKEYWEATWRGISSLLLNY